MSATTSRRPLSWRAEARRQLGRRRTAWIFGIIAALPIILVIAFAFDNGDGNDASGPTLVDVATHGGANFGLFSLLVSSEVLLAIVGSMLVGDSLPAEASWSSLRYLLSAPVGRARLVTSKLVVGFTTFCLAALLLPAWSILVGLIAYGNGAFVSPSGYEVAASAFAARVLVSVAYIVVSLSPVAAIAFWLGARTDTPLAAVGGAFVALVICGILDSINALGDWRKALIGHYSRAWLEMFTQPPLDPGDMIHGTLWAILWTLVFLAVGYRHFTRKDVLS